MPHFVSDFMLSPVVRTVCLHRVRTVTRTPPKEYEGKFSQKIEKSIKKKKKTLFLPATPLIWTRRQPFGPQGSKKRGGGFVGPSVSYTLLGMLKDNLVNILGSAFNASLTELFFNRILWMPENFTDYDMDPIPDSNGKQPIHTGPSLYPPPLLLHTLRPP